MGMSRRKLWPYRKRARDGRGRHEPERAGEDSATPDESSRPPEDPAAMKKPISESKWIVPAYLAILAATMLLLTWWGGVPQTHIVPYSELERVLESGRSSAWSSPSSG